MFWQIEFTDIADKQLSKLDKPIKKRIINWLDERLTSCENPKLWGDSLVGDLSGMWRYRIGDYRVICEINNSKLTVLIVELGHRRDIYK